MERVTPLLLYGTVGDHKNIIINIPVVFDGWKKKTFYKGKKYLMVNFVLTMKVQVYIKIMAKEGTYHGHNLCIK